MNEDIIHSKPRYFIPESVQQKKSFIYYLNKVFSAVSPRELTKGVKISTTVHLSLLVFAVIGPLIIPHRYKNFAPTVHSVQLINMPGSVQQSTPVTKPEISAPPKQKQEVRKPKPEPKIIEQKKPAEKPIQQKPKMTVQAKEKAKPKEKPKPKEKTPTLKERLAQRLKEDKTKWKEPDSIKTETKKQTEMDETVFSGALGTSGTLGIASASDFPFQWYLELIHGKISSCWTDPQMALDKQSNAIISFTITKTGEIKNIFVKKSAGTQSFDQSGIKAIELAKPYPQLPIGYRDNELTVNVEFNLQNERF